MSDATRCWYYRGTGRIEAQPVHRFDFDGQTYVVLKPQDGELEVRPTYLVSDHPMETIGFASVSDEFDAEIADMVMPNARQWPGRQL